MMPSSPHSGTAALSTVLRTHRQRRGNPAARGGDTLSGLAQQAAGVASASEYNRAAVDSLAAAYAAGGITGAQFSGALEGLEARHRAATIAANEQALETGRLAPAMNEAATASAALSEELVDQAEKSLNAKVEAEKLSQFQAVLADLGSKVYDGLLTSAQAADILKQAYGDAIPNAERLLALQAALAGAKNVETVKTGNFTSNADRLAGENGRAGGTEAVNIVKQGTAALVAADAATAAYRNQILQTGSTLEVLNLRQKEYNDAVKQFGAGSAKAIDAQTALKQAQEAHQRFLDKPPKGGRNPKDPNARGLGALAKDDIALAGDYQAQLAEVNRQLEAGNLTAHQRNQLLQKQADLQEKIADETLRTNRANVEGQLAVVKDAQEKIKEKRDLDAAQRILANPGEFGGDFTQLASLRVQEIGLEQEKRRFDIADKERAASGFTPVNGAPIPQFAGATALGPITPVGVGPTPAGAMTQGAASDERTLIMQVDGKELGRIVARFLSSGRQPVQAVG